MERDLADNLNPNPDPKWRVCALCLIDVLRSDYNDHMMKAHGYEIIEILPAPPRDDHNPG